MSAWFWCDLLMVVDGLMGLGLILMWVWAAYNQPTRYLWMMIKMPNIGNVLYFTTSTIAILALSRIGKDEPWWSVFLANAVVASFLWWFINYTHRQAIRCFDEDCREYLPDSCEFCIFFRAGIHYKFWKKQIPEHPDCREAR